MILGSSFEFERHSNPEVQERPSDNMEVPQVIFQNHLISYLNCILFQCFKKVNERFARIARKNQRTTIFISV